MKISVMFIMFLIVCGCCFIDIVFCFYEVFNKEVDFLYKCYIEIIEVYGMLL